MTSILVPVDFSPSSASAFQFALELNRSFYADIHLLHIFDMPIVKGEGEALFETDYNSIKKRFEEKLWDFINLYKSDYLYEFSVSAHAGGHYTGIQSFIREFHPNLVIVGNKGTGGLKRLLFGNVSRYLLTHPNVPVIAIPQAKEINRLKTAVLATDLSEKAAGFDFGFLTNFLQKTGMKLDIIHVEEYGTEVISYKEEEKRWMEETLGSKVKVIKAQKGQQIIEAISMFLNNHKADIVITIPHFHTWMDQLLIGSETTELAKNVRIPLMALPGNTRT